jgi:hypothetical protein
LLGDIVNNTTNEDIQALARRALWWLNRPTEDA